MLASPSGCSSCSTMIVVFRRAKLAENASLVGCDLLVLVVVDVAEGEGAERRPKGHQADDHAEVADAIDDERLVGRRRSALALDIEADQEVRTDAHQLPEDEHHEDVPREDEAEHAEAEQRQKLKKTRKTSGPVQLAPVRQPHFVVGDRVQLVVHVAHRVEVDTGGDERHHAEHADGQRVDVVADRDAQAAELREQVVFAGVVDRRGGVMGGGGVISVVAALCVSCAVRNIVRLRVSFVVVRALWPVMRQPDEQK
jgi:hypothetical protein